jgi:hypothetical protein
MSSFTYQKALQLIQNSKSSNPDYDSTQQLCFFKDQSSKDGEIGFETPEVNKILQDLPISTELSILYKVIGNPKVEFYLEDWILMSLNKVNERYQIYQDHNRIDIIDFAFIYGGMGHIVIAGMDLTDGKIYYRHDGGSNGWERKDRFEFACTYKPEDDKKISFDQWLKDVRDKVVAFDLTNIVGN